MEKARYNISINIKCKSHVKKWRKWMPGRNEQCMDSIDWQFSDVSFENLATSLSSDVKTQMTVVKEYFT